MEVQGELNRLAKTVGLGPALAANIYAGTTGLETVGALNAKAGILNPNQTFDADTNGWFGQGATIARSTAVLPPRGIAAALVTPDGIAVSGGISQAVATPVGSIIPGNWYQARAWVNSPSGNADLRTCIDWVDASNVYITTGLGVGTSVPAGQWTLLSQYLQAPANASRAAVRVRHGGTPPASAIYYAWDIRLTDPTFDVDLQGAANDLAGTVGLGTPLALSLIPTPL